MNETEQSIMTDPDAFILDYARKYAKAKADDDQDAEVARNVLFMELSAYRSFLAFDEENPQEVQTWSPFQNTILFAAEMAECFPADQEFEQAVERLQSHMIKDGRTLPIGVAEWVVENVVQD